MFVFTLFNGFIRYGVYRFLYSAVKIAAAEVDMTITCTMVMKALVDQTD